MIFNEKRVDLAFMENVITFYEDTFLIKYVMLEKTCEKKSSSNSKLSRWRSKQLNAKFCHKTIQAGA